jgi:hypothetical protein
LEKQQERRRKSKRKLKKGKREDQEMTRRVICVRCFCTWGYAFLFCALCHLSLSLRKTGTEMEINMGRLLPFAHHLTFAVPVKALPSSANLSSTSFLCLWHEAKL